MLAYLNAEEGAVLVKQIIENPDNTLMAHALNLCEVYYDVHRSRGEARAESFLSALVADGLIERSDLDPAFWREVGRMKSGLGRISLADACGVALTQRAAGHFVTSDHHELDRVASAGACPILFIR